MTEEVATQSLREDKGARDSFSVVEKSEPELWEKREPRRQATMNIDANILCDEPELHNNKWFDYRYIPAHEATVLCMNAFVNEYRRFWAKYRDDSESNSKQPIRFNDLWKNCRAIKTSIWKLRQMIDMLGVPYPFFFFHGFTYFLDRRNWRHFPMPNQFMAEMEVGPLADYILTKQQERLEIYELPHDVKDSHYKEGNYTGDPNQVAFRRQLEQWFQQWPPAKRHARTERLVHTHKLLAASDARSLLETGTMEEPARRPNTAMEAFRPSCFGLPHAKSPQGGICSSCPVRVKCGVEVDTVLEQVKNAHGTDKPVLERRRKMDRDRQAKCRDRKRQVKLQPVRDDISAE